MSRKELLKNLRTKIKDVETRPRAKSILEGIKKSSGYKPGEPVLVPDCKKKMIWKNLCDGLCPACANPLMDNPKDTRLIICSTCDFKIKATRTEEILKNLDD